MSTTNCVNCGAVKEMDATQCPFCGTLYFDLTALDLEHNYPVACVFKMPGCYSNIEKVTMLARPFLESIEQEPMDTVDLWADNRRISYVRSQQPPHFNLRFDPVTQHDGKMIMVYTKDK